MSELRANIMDALVKSTSDQLVLRRYITIRKYSVHHSKYKLTLKVADLVNNSVYIAIII